MIGMNNQRNNPMTDQHNDLKNELWWLQDAINNFLESTPHKEYLQSLHDRLNTRAEPRPAEEQLINQQLRKEGDVEMDSGSNPLYKEGPLTIPGEASNPPAGEPTVKPGLQVQVSELLSKAGVFKGADGLERFLECQDFWEKQPYGTRLYFGEGGLDYLHRDVLRTAIRLIADHSAEIERLRSDVSEADRRAGEAERRLESANDTIYKSSCWRDGIKIDLGYSHNTSFDIVWSETLAKAKESDQLRERVKAAGIDHKED